MKVPLPEHEWSNIRRRAERFPEPAFDFVRDGLSHTVGMVHGADAADANDSPEASRHVSGQQLCLGLRDLAIQRWGRLAPVVLGRWGIHRTEDFGVMVYAMIDRESMRPSGDDTFDDFRDVYDFDEAFAPESLTGQH